MVGKCRAGPVAVLVLGLIALFGHVVYPALLGARTRRLRDVDPPDADCEPDLTVVIPAFREASVIEAKIDSVCDNGYEGRLDVIVVAEDDPTATAARRTSARVLSFPDRLGKAQALNAGIGAAQTEIVVFTDANNPLEHGALASLSRWFADPTVGAVAGEKRVEGSDGEGIYWRFESWLKRRENRTGSTIGLVGELGAIRAPIFQPLPAKAVVDDLWIALDVIEGGYRVVYEPQAVTREGGSAVLAEEWERRSRIIAGLIDLLVRRRHLLVPGRSPATFQLWGHRLVRSSVGPIAHCMLLFGAMGRIRSSRVCQLFVAGHAVGGIALVLTWRGRRMPRVPTILAQALFLQVVALGGLVRYLRRDRLAKWPKAERQVANSPGPVGKEQVG